jgi:hypothetical protein
MSKIIEFKGKEEQEQHSCDVCDLAYEYLEYCIDAESPEELFEILSDLINEAKVLGMKQLLINQVNQSMELLDELHGVCDCEDCCESEE